MTKEIGGYFGLENSTGCKEYYEKLIPLNTGRNALVYLFRSLKISKIFIPFYLCDSIREVCKRENVKYEFYEIDDSFLPIFNKNLTCNEYLYVVNYFGQLTKKQIKQLKKKHKNIILDNVQAFFAKPIKNINTIYSCRKFFGVPDGSYLYTKKSLSDELEVDDSSQRMSHIYGRIKDGASYHFDEFQKNDKFFYSLNLRKMSSTTHSLLKNVDYLFVKKRREKNFKYLHRRLYKENELSLRKCEGPYCYPFLIKNGDILKKKLINEKIYVATLWPETTSSNAQFLAKNLLPLPCDQRYSKTEMDIIIKEIKKCTKN